MKTNLVQLRNGVPTTTSLQVAQMFGKEHAKVLSAIRQLDCSPEFIAANFGLHHYSSKLNENVTRRLPMYYITRDGFTFLVMGFAGKITAKFNLVVKIFFHTFVSNYILKGGSCRSFLRAFFMPNFSFGFVPPCGTLMRPLPFRCSSTGQAKPFFFVNC